MLHEARLVPAAVLALLLNVGPGNARDYPRPGYAASGFQPAQASALITNCYASAERVVPRGRGRQAWVVRHADQCIRGGGRL
jgi:hypothetical protein